MARLFPGGAFEYQGQKCSAASRAYVPKTLWGDLKDKLIADVQSFKMGTTEDLGNFINAVIDERAFDKIASYIDFADQSNDAEILVGGKYDKAQGYFIEPTIIVTDNPMFKTMEEEIFGPVLTIHPFEDNDFLNICRTANNTSPYALTGSVFSNDRGALLAAMDILKNAAGELLYQR